MNKFVYYKQFCARFNLVIFPQSHYTLEEQLIAFCTEKLYNKPSRSGTLMQTIYAIRSASLSMNNKPIFVTEQDMPRLHAFMRNNDKINPPGEGTKLIDADILNKLLQHLSKRIHDECIFRVVYTMMHNTMRRPEEIEYPKEMGLRYHQLRWRNNHLLPLPSDDFCIYHFYYSKKNVTRQHQTAIIFCICNTITGRNREICALCELKRLYSWRTNINPNGLIFEFRNKSLFNYTKARNMLQKLNQLCGWKANEYTLKGFRAGGSFDAGLRGISLKNIMRQSGWKNPETILRYQKKRTINHIRVEIQQEQKTTRINNSYTNKNNSWKNGSHTNMNPFFVKRRKKRKGNRQRRKRLLLD